MTSTGPGSISVVLATYQWPGALEVVLRALAEQKGESFEVVVADDGSGDETAQLIQRWSGHFEMRHVWQPDEGFRKARAFDLAALAAGGNYLVFLDGDCMPRRGFMNAVRRAALPGWFLSTKRLNLSPSLSTRVVDRGVPIWRWSAAEWLLRAPRHMARPGYLVPARDRRRPWREGQPEFFPPGASYCFVGLPRADFERVNGYDARCVRWNDGEDQDLAIRLRRSGLRCGWPGPASTLLHLWHATRKQSSNPHSRLYRETAAGTHVEAMVGLRELRGELTAGPMPPAAHTGR